MKTLLTIAVRNLVRHRLRTVITAFTICIGVVSFLAMDSLMDGSNKDAFDNIVYLTGSALKIHTAEYLKEKNAFPLDYGIPEADAVMRSIRGKQGVVGAAPRVRFIGQLSNYTDMLPVSGVVVDPARDAEVFRIPEYVESGTYLTPGGTGEIVIGKDLAEDLGLAPGGSVVLSANDLNEVMNAYDFTVVGVINAPVSGLNSNGVFISWPDGDRLLGLDGLVTEIDVQMEWKPGAPFAELSARSDVLSKELAAAYPSLSFDPVSEQARSFLALIGSKSKFSGIIILIVLAIALVGIVNTVLMSVYERIREVGVMRAMGFQGKEVRRMFFLEGTIIGLLGSAAGVLLGGALVWLLVQRGMDMNAFGLDISSFNMPVSPVIHGVWKPQSFIQILVIGTLSAMLAALLPARKAAKIVVTRALRFE
jgi:ABC-type lipoprotein release transport system permease subunit